MLRLDGHRRSSRCASLSFSLSAPSWLPGAHVIALTTVQPLVGEFCVSPKI